MKYDYVLVAQFDKEQPYIWGAKNLDVLVGLIANVTYESDTVKYRAFTKADADKKGLIPDVTCNGPSKKVKKKKT